MHRMFKLARFFSVATLLTALLSSCFGPSIYFTSKIAPDTAVTIVTEKFIPYGNDDYQIDEVVLPNGDLVIARSLQEDTAVVERFDNDTLRVVWERRIYLGEHQVWSPQMKYDETDGTIAIIARKKWDGGDSVGLQGLELDANTGAIRQERWLAKHYSTNDSIDTRSGYQYDYSEDNSKFLYFYLDYSKITETDDNVPKTLDVNFEVFDLKFKRLGGGKITRQLPQEVDDDREEIGKYFRGVIVDNNGDVYTVNLAIPGRIEVTKHWIATGTQKTLEAKWDDVNILEDDKTFGGMAFESDNIDNLYLAAPFKIDRGVSGGIVLAKYNFNTQQVPVVTRFNFTPQQTEMMVGDDELKNFFVNAVTLHNGTAIVHFENDNSGWVRTKHGSYYQWESNDLILLGFDLTGKPLYQTVLNKKQASIPNMGNGGYEIGYAYMKSGDGLRFYYIDRQNEGLVTRLLDTKTGSLSNPKGVLSLGFNASFVKHATDYNSKNDCWYFCMHKGIGAENAYIYKVKMDENHMRTLIQSR